MGPNSRTESFQQYATTNLDQLTLMLTQQTSSTHDHLEQPLTTPIGLQYTSNKFHYQPDNINNNEFDQQQLHPQDNNFGSNHYNHFDEYLSQMEENLDGLETVDANSGFDDGGWDNSGFDEGSEDGGFDNGGFDGFDDGCFDNDDGSTY
ncbi:hypothetical protein PGTUg99_004895 [Puccinia graminis f. sp. tritici]|uniref:Uncharacterized protein n=1 Tax=Puccinia graminis f. sp. tritici TaxID=56615 RepID=A0A5B0RGL8_PUCGR|nr:hypothetical protein PGTUg99_004895 [Puccinia graminis f. sp. tritici]